MKIRISFVLDDYAGDNSFEIEQLNNAFTAEKIIPEIKSTISLSDDESGEHFIVDYVDYSLNDENELYVFVACIPD